MATLTWTGLEELREAMQRLPEELVDDATDIVRYAAQDAMDAIRLSYPRVTGNLQDGLKTSVKEVGRYGVAYVVKNTSPHAWMYENGTQARHTALGLSRGVMPPGHVFVPIAERRRAVMYRQLRDMLVAHGLVVTGVV